MLTDCAVASLLVSVGERAGVHTLKNAPAALAAQKLCIFGSVQVSQVDRSPFVFLWRVDSPYACLDKRGSVALRPPAWVVAKRRSPGTSYD